jgi:hypothetical protein
MSGNALFRMEERWFGLLRETSWRRDKKECGGFVAA